MLERTIRLIRFEIPKNFYLNEIPFEMIDKFIRQTCSQKKRKRKVRKEREEYLNIKSVSKTHTRGIRYFHRED